MRLRKTRSAPLNGCKLRLSVRKELSASKMNVSVIKYLIEVTSQPRATADLHILDPRNPLPPQTTRRFVAAVAISEEVIIEALEERVSSREALC